MAKTPIVTKEGLTYYDSKLKNILSGKEELGAAEEALSSSKEYTDAELQDFASEVNASLTVLGQEIDSKANATHDHEISDITGLQAELDTASDHISNSDVHFTAAERTKLSGIAENANNYSHPNSGVTAGTYKSVTVNAQGHVTGGSNPTTLAGYGITDAETKGTVNTHNTATDAHNDIRIALSNLTTKVNNFLDIDDTTSDQLSEVIALIQANATQIETITSGKVNVSDIVNNLTTNIANQPLSAAQGVMLKGLVDNLQTSLGTANTNIENLQTTVGEIETALSDKSEVGHTHEIANVNGLQTALDGKSATGHGHAVGDVTGLQTALDNKSNTGHGHAIADITNLQNTLNTMQEAIDSAGGGSFSFDALIDASGFSYTYTKSSNTHTETIKQGSTTYATRTSTKNTSTGVWTVAIVCSAAGVNVTKTYTPTSTGWSVA